MAENSNKALNLFIIGIAVLLVLRIVARVLLAPIPTRLIFFISVAVVGGIGYVGYKAYSAAKQHTAKQRWRKEMEISLKDMNNDLDSKVTPDPKNTEDLSKGAAKKATQAKTTPKVEITADNDRTSKPSPR